MKKQEETRILSVEDVLHLQSDKHTKEKIMPDVDNSRFVLNQRAKAANTARKFAPAVNISDEQRRQFSQGNSAPNRNAELAQQCRQAIGVAEIHAKEEAKEQAKASAEKTEKAAKATKKLAQEIKSGNFEFGFGAFIEGSENLKDTI